jgi:NAD(P)-dependent dehydrogenase (short-subunit alcohol dehydrogenase family)
MEVYMELPPGLRIFDLSGKTALITGGSRGLGAAAAQTLAAVGAQVVICGRTEADLLTARDGILAAGGTAHAIVADVTDEAAVEHMFDEVVARFGRLDVLINNAGKNIRKPALELSTAEFDDVLSVNLRSYFMCARAAGRIMVQQGQGRVINISSILATIGLPTQTAYATSKGGIAQLTRVLAIEWAPFGVTVNAIGPTYFETELTRPLYEDPERREFITARTPMGRWGQPHELAGTLVLLASDASAFITGQTIFVDGGWLAW